ncbi:MAG TPA: MFS transporter [Kofleriaceae bacterium]|nr:MFS transporter [Kofleriaceae bacterium]
MRLLTAAFALASLSNFLHSLSFNLYLHLSGFLAQLGASEVEIGVIFGVTAATAIAVRPAMGRAMDTRGIRLVIVAGGALNTLVCALYTTVTALGPLLYAVRIVHGVAEAMLFASLFAFAAEIVPPARRIEGIALFGASGMLPVGLGGLLGDLLLHGGSYGPLFTVSFAFALVALLLSLPLRDPPRDPGPPPRGIAAALFQRDLVPLWLSGAAFATALAAHFTFLKTFVLASGTGSVGLFFSAYSGAAIALRVGCGKLPERVGPKRALYPAMVSMFVGQCVLAVASGSASVAVAGVLCGLGHGFAFPILLALVVTRARPTERGAALAIYTALFDAGILAGGPLLGAVIAAAGYRAMFFTAAGLVATAAAVLAVLDRARPAAAAGR